MKKIIIFSLLVACLVAALCVPAMAQTVNYKDRYGDTITFGADEFCVKYNGEAVSFPDAQPFVDANNRTLVPVRFVSEKMGARVEWDGETRTVSVYNDEDGIRVDIAIGKKDLTVTKSGATSTVTMDTEAIISEDRTFVPVRFVAEALGAWVGYSDLFNTAQIYADKLSPEEINRLHSYYDMTHDEFMKQENAYGMGKTQAEWDDSHPWLAYFASCGEYGFSNANEWTMRSQSRNWATYRGYVTGKTFKKGVQSEAEFAKLAVEEAKSSVTAQFYKDGIIAMLKTDLSCAFNSRSYANTAVFVRGVLTVAVPKDASANTIAVMRNTYGHADAKAGDVFEADVEVVIATDPTNGGVYCRNMRELS